MVLDITRALKNPGQAYPFEGTIEIPEMEVLDDPVRFGDVVVKGEFLGAGESVSVKAMVEANVYSRCAKCLEDVASPIAAEIDEVFARAVDPENPDQRELTESAIDMDELVKDALLLEIPIRFLCSEDCKGLCPVCGVNRNLVPCTCQEGGEVTNPFSALRDLLN